MVRLRPDALFEHWQKIDEPAVGRALARKEYSVTSDRDGIVVLKRSGL